VAMARHCAPSMSLAQRASAYLALLAFGLPSVFVALVGGEVWPFLDYRMYAEAKPTPEVDWLDLVGRTETGRAFPLHDERYIVPFAFSELLRALYSLDVLGEVQAAPARRALVGLLVAYEEGRQVGEHDGPRLVSLEVYRVRWTARPGASNYASPDSRTLLQVVSLPKAYK
jgi:hypothetical protein